MCCRCFCEPWRIGASLQPPMSLCLTPLSLSFTSYAYSSLLPCLSCSLLLSSPPSSFVFSFHTCALFLTPSYPCFIIFSSPRFCLQPSLLSSPLCFHFWWHLVLGLNSFLLLIFQTGCPAVLQYMNKAAVIFIKSGAQSNWEWCLLFAQVFPLTALPTRITTSGHSTGAGEWPPPPVSTVR